MFKISASSSFFLLPALFLNGCSPVSAQISFPTPDGGEIFADLYPGEIKNKPNKAIILAHGMIFNKASWGDLAKLLSEKGWTVMAIDFRGYGKSRPGRMRGNLAMDIAGAIDYLKAQGFKKISLLGGSMGGRAVLEAARGREDLDRVIGLAPLSVHRINKIKASLLLIVSRKDRLKRTVKLMHKQAASPKKLVILPGKAHAQHIFDTDAAEELIKAIISFLES